MTNTVFRVFTFEDMKMKTENRVVNKEMKLRNSKRSQARRGANTAGV